MSQFNPCTVSIKLEGNGNTVVYSSRDGVSQTIIDETLNHLFTAVEALQNGMFELDEQWSKRTPVESPATHGEAMVTCFMTNPIMVQSGKRVVPVSVNVFTETTSAQDLLNHVSIAIDGLGDSLDKFFPVSNVANPQNATQSNWDKRVLPEDTTLEQFLKTSDFSSHPDNPRNQAQPTPQPAQPASDEQTSMLLNPASKSEDWALFEQYVGSNVFAFKVRGITMIFDRYGNRTFQFYGEYNGNISKYPITYKIDFKINDRNKEYHPELITYLKSLNPEVGKMIAVNGRWVGRINQGSNGKLYYNVIKFDPTPATTAPINWQAQIQQPATPAQPATTPTLQNNQFADANAQW